MVLGALSCTLAGAANAQLFLTSRPPYPIAARRMHVQGAGAVRVTFTEYFALPAKAEVATTTGNRLLDDTMLAWVRQNWMVINFTAAERTDSRAMDERLKRIIPSETNRRTVVQLFAREKLFIQKFPVTKTVPIRFVMER